jgi:hypothetical protein
MIPALSTMVCARVKSASVAAALSASQISVEIDGKSPPMPEW